MAPVRAARIAALAAAAAVGLAGPSAAGAATKLPGSSTLQWIELSLYRIGKHGFDVPRQNRAAALAAVGVYDAVAHAPARSDRYAAAGAATTILEYLLPSQARELAAQAVPYRRHDPLAFRIGVAYGRAAVARAKHDGSRRHWHGTLPQGPGSWQPTPPSGGRPVEPLAGTWRTWNLRSGSQFRPPPPPAPGTPEFVRDEQLVFDISQTLTPREVALARFWASPRSAWSTTAAVWARQARLPERRAARVLAAVLVAQYDATIACWDAKYAYWSIRPVTAIQRDIDATWRPLLTTPLWPSYVSAHATISAAAAEMLARFFPRRASAARELARHAADSRVFAGVHFPTDNQVGLELGRRVAKVELARLGRLSRLLAPQR